MTADSLPEAVQSTAREIVDAAYRVRRTLGPGLLESVYEACLAHELTKRGVAFARQVSAPVIYEGLTIEAGLRLDFIVGDCVVVELKAIERLLPVHDAQILTYLKLTGLRLGLLINFNVPLIKQGIRRFII